MLGYAAPVRPVPRTPLHAPVSRYGTSSGALSQDAKPTIGGGTGIALSLVITLGGAVWNYATTASDVKHLGGAVQELKASDRVNTADLATMKADIRSVRESAERIERAVERLAEPPQPLTGRGRP